MVFGLPKTISFPRSDFFLILYDPHIGIFFNNIAKQTPSLGMKYDIRFTKTQRIWEYFHVPI